MSRPHSAARLAALLLIQAGCGLYLNRDPEPIVQGRLPAPAEEDPQTTFAFAGEVRDFATFRPEPEAVIEFWSEHPSYTPTVKRDGRGGFSIRMEACRRPATTATRIAASVLVGGPPGCPEPIGRWGLRARDGDRCSFAIDASTPAGRAPLVLWLRDCAGTRGEHAWRRAPDEPEPR